MAQDYERGRDRDHRDDATQQQDDRYPNDRRRGRDRQQQQQQQPTPQQMPQTQPQQRDWDRGDRERSDRDIRGDRDRDRSWGDNDRRDWRYRGDRRGDAAWDRYRRNYDAPRRFRVGIYRAPPGYYYRRWRYGDYLPGAYYARSFWLTDFVIYGLFPPPPGLIWVRYGPDAMLIDEYTGEIVQVRYNVFYY